MPGIVRCSLLKGRRMKIQEIRLQNPHTSSKRVTHHNLPVTKR